MFRILKCRFRDFSQSLPFLPSFARCSLQNKSSFDTLSRSFLSGFPPCISSFEFGKDKISVWKWKLKNLDLLCLFWSFERAQIRERTPYLAIFWRVRRSNKSPHSIFWRFPFENGCFHRSMKSCQFSLNHNRNSYHWRFTIVFGP